MSSTTSSWRTAESGSPPRPGHGVGRECRLTVGVEPRDGELGAVGQSKLVEHRADAVAHGALAQIQSGGDVAVVESLGDERRDVTLSFVQQLIDAIRRTTAVRDAVAGRVRGVVRPLHPAPAVGPVSLPITSAPSTT